MARKKKPRDGKLIYVIPDAQVKPGHSTAYLRAIGLHILDKRPDIIVCLGDWADMASLSSWDRRKLQFEGRRYKQDIAASKKAMESLLGPIREYNLGKPPEEQYRPRMVLTLGNHEDRINRFVADNPELEGHLSVADLQYEKYGWEVVPFLEPIVIEGIVFCHYLTSGVMGRPITTAAAILQKRHMSAVVGHQQGRMIHDQVAADGRQLRAIIAGSCYEHDEDYLGPQGNRHWRGVVLLHAVKNGEFIEQFVTIRHLKRKYREQIDE